jgi:4-coumarate--CoA ligase
MAFDSWPSCCEPRRLQFSRISPNALLPNPIPLTQSNTSRRIIDESLHDVPPHSLGEILVKGPVVTRGYHNNAAATRAAFLFDGWFRTGDIGQYRDGKVYIVDRAKDLIKYKALQVAPAELETVLLSHPLIADAAVIGVQGNDTELPRAYVVAVDRARIDEGQVKKWVKERVAEYKQLRGGVVFVDAIPKNASGKILKKDLRAMAQKDAQREGRAKL